MRRIPRASSSPFGGGEGGGGGVGPDEVLEFASQAVEYVRRSLGVTLEYDSETLPILDHYLRQVVTEPGPDGVPDPPTGSATELVAATAGAYFGEVVRRRLGGSWHMPSRDPGSWRLVLPTGLWFFPAAMAMAAILGPEGDTASGLERSRDPDRDDNGDSDAAFAAGEDRPDDEVDADDSETDAGANEWDASLQAPPLLRSHVARVLHSMADVSEEEYYSLCCRLDTLEHVQAVLAAMASARQSRRDRDPGTLD